MHPVNGNISLTFGQLPNEVVEHIVNGMVVVPRNTEATRSVLFNFLLVEKCVAEQLKERVSEFRLGHRLSILDAASADRSPDLYRKVHAYFRDRCRWLRDPMPDVAVERFAFRLLEMTPSPDFQALFNELLLDLDNPRISLNKRAKVLSWLACELTPYFEKAAPDALVGKLTATQQKVIRFWIDGYKRLRESLQASPYAVASEIERLGKACWNPSLIKHLMNLQHLESGVRNLFLLQTQVAQANTVDQMFPPGGQSAQQAQTVLTRLLKDLWLPALETMDDEASKSTLFGAAIMLMSTLKEKHFQFQIMIRFADIWRVIIKQLPVLTGNTPWVVCSTLRLLKNDFAQELLKDTDGGREVLLASLYQLTRLHRFSETYNELLNMALALSDAESEPLLRFLICEVLAGQQARSDDPDDFQPNWRRAELTHCLLELLPELPSMATMIPQLAIAPLSDTGGE